MNPFYQKREIKTNLKKDEIYELISKNTYQKSYLSSWSSFGFVKEYFKGTLNGYEFDVYKTRNMFRYNYASPNIKGRIEDKKLNYVINMNPVSIVSMIIVLILSIDFLFQKFYFFSALLIAVVIIAIVIYFIMVKKTNSFLEKLLK